MNARCHECNCTPCQCFKAEIDYPEINYPEINYPRISKPYWGGPSARRVRAPSRRGTWGARIQIIALAILAVWFVYCLWYAKPDQGAVLTVRCVQDSAVWHD